LAWLDVLKFVASRLTQVLDRALILRYFVALSSIRCMF
jgi:hypothetical protein